MTTATATTPNAQDAEPWRRLYPFASNFLTLAGGQRLHYLDEGPPDAAETLLLVHGNPTWSFYWRELIAAWRGEHRVLAIDHVGCGLSDKPQDYPYRLAQHVANLGELVERLDLRNVTLVAHDWGGAIGLGVATAQPRPFARLVLMNTAAFRSQRIPWRIRVCRTPVLGAIAVRGFNAFLRAAFRMALVDRRRIAAPVVRAGYVAPYDSWANRVALHRFVQDIPLRPRHPSFGTLTQIEAGLAKLADLPCLLAWGMRDWCFTPDFLRRFQEVFPRAETREFAHAGHWVVEDAAAELIEAIPRFMAANPIAGARP